MLTKEQNQLICRVGPGTPGGEFLRRYWQAVAFSSDVQPGGQPKAITIMGEELVLFRDQAGQPGLLGLRCSHRLTSLNYGRVEDGGLRCPFHGWVYDVNGRCLEQPAEPKGSTFKERIRHPSYPCEELGGLIFAYMGPADKKPLLPRYEVLVREDGERDYCYYWSDGNYLQHLEGTVDTAHFAYLHQDRWSHVKHLLKELPTPEIEIEETEYGHSHKSVLPNVRYGNVLTVFTHFFMPAGFMLARGNFEDGGRTGIKKRQSWYTPIDDTRTLRLEVGFAPEGTRPGIPPGEARPGEEWVNPKPLDYYRDYYNVDTIHGIPMSQFRSQDIMVNESQGDIVDRSREHLGAQDRIVMVMRQLMFDGIKDVQAGRDPKHIIRDPAQNAVVYLRGADQLEFV